MEVAPRTSSSTMSSAFLLAAASTAARATSAASITGWGRPLRADWCSNATPARPARTVPDSRARRRRRAWACRWCREWLGWAAAGRPEGRCQRRRRPGPRATPGCTAADAAGFSSAGRLHRRAGAAAVQRDGSGGAAENAQERRHEQRHEWDGGKPLAPAMPEGPGLGLRAGLAAASIARLGHTAWGVYLSRGMARACQVSWLGRMDYQQAWDLQTKLVRERARGLIPDQLLLLEHPHVFTFGRRGRTENVLSSDEEIAAA